MNANGGERVKIYAPSTWAQGSSYSHLDNDTFRSTVNRLMVYSTPSGQASHDPGPVTKGIFKDLGWSLTSGGNGGSSNLGSALEASSLNWSTSGSANWVVDSRVQYSGGSAARSGGIGHSQSSCLNTTVTGPTTLSFYWQVSSEANYDVLRFSVNGTVRRSISGSVSWTPIQESLGSGTHQLQWCYFKDGSVSAGSDAGWVDRVSLSGGSTTTYTLGVKASGASGVSIGSSSGHDGTTNYTRTGLSSGTSVSLTAPSSSGTFTFSSWSGCTSTSGTSCTVTMNANKTVTANYTAGSSGGGSSNLGSALEATSLNWSTSGHANWVVDSSAYYSGGSAARSGRIGHSQSSCLSTTVTGPTTLSFYWGVSSEANYDVLRFSVNGTVRRSISGWVNWTQVQESLSSGTHQLQWCYVKDRSVSSGSDAGWVDRVSRSGGTTNYEYTP
jgi:hypothetical protein